MVDARAATPVVPMKRTLEDDHAPNVSSPLNPDAIARARPARAPAREQREKKDSLKKRETVGAVRSNTPEYPVKKQKTKSSEVLVGAPSPIRYNHVLPRELFHYSIRDAGFSSRETEPLFSPNGVELKKPLDHAENKKNFRYAHCIADPSFSYSHYYRSSDSKPYNARMSFEDSDKWFHFDESATIMTNEKGWRMGRANVVAREGSFYYEVRILRGVTRESPSMPSENAQSSGPLPHIRMGWARREAPLDSPVGFDGYSYGMTDIRMDPMHRSRASKYLDDGSDKAQTKKALKSKTSKSKGNATNTALQGFAANDHAREGDVIGLEITLPSLSLHRKIVEGNYNPAVDVGSGLDQPTVSTNEEGALNIVRDRFPVPYKGTMYFESFEYRSSKGMEGYGDRGPFAKESPSPNHSDPTLRCLPHSSIKIWKNGRRVGTAFRNLMAFLPPASAPEMQKGVRTDMDDGSLGYYPAIAVFSGGIAEINVGPNFWFPPPSMRSGVASNSADVKNGDVANLQMEIEEQEAVMSGLGVPSKIRPISDRYQEQIAEDVMWDLIDEADFYMQDAGMN